MDYQILPPLSDEELIALRDGIALHGIKVAVEYDEQGNILDGHHRVQIARELGIIDWPRVVRAGLSEEEKIEHILEINLTRRHLTREQRQQTAIELRQRGWSTPRIAKQLGIGNATAWRDLSASSNEEADNLPDHITGADGKQYPAHRAVYQPVEATIFSSKSEEYDTPNHILEMARSVLGEFDLDPASNEDAQKNVQAKIYYTKEQDGLSQTWIGRIWLNPPYGKTNGESNQELWSQHLVEEYRTGNVTEAILLVKAALGYRWFEELFRNWPVCFLRDRLSFILDDGNDKGQSKQGTAIFYLGKDFMKFAEAFRHMGRIIPPEEQLNATLFG